ncbi:DUF3618 domain-containing protein [soil metagenome]
MIHDPSQGDNRSTDAIRSDIRTHRSRMDDTLEALNQRLSPRSLLRDLFDWWDSSDHQASSEAGHKLARSGRRAGRSIGRAVRENPLPAALIGTGIIWALATSEDDDDEGADYEDFGDTHEYGDSRADSYTGAAAYGGASTASNLEQGGYGGSGSLKDKAAAAGDKIKGAAGSAKESASHMGDSARAAGQSIRARGRETYARGRRAGRRARARTTEQARELYASAEQRYERAMDEAPLALGFGALGLGLLAGLLIPRSRREDELFGDASHDLTEAAADKGRELAGRAKAVGERVASAAMDEADRQGLTSDKVGDAVASVTEKVRKVGQAAKEEAHHAKEDEGLSAEDLKEEARQSTDKSLESAGAKASEKAKSQPLSHDAPT